MAVKCCWNLGAEWSEIKSGGIAQCDVASVVLEREEASRIDGFDQTSVARQVAVVGRVDGVVARFFAELERKERRRPPRDVGVHMDLVTGVAQMGETTATHRSQVHLWSRC